MPMVRQMLRDLSGFPCDTGVNPVIAVALGAALYAHMLDTDSAPKAIHLKPVDDGRGQPGPSAGPTSGRPAADEPTPVQEGIPASESLGLPQVRFVTAHGVGLRVLTARGQTLNQVLIPRNSPVPTSATRRYLTQRNKGHGDRLKLTVTQGDADDPELVEVLGALYISGLPPDEPGGQPVDVSMSFNRQGRLYINAVYLNTGQSLRQSLEIPGGLREEQVLQYRRLLEETGLVRKQPPKSGLLDEIILEDEEDLPVLDPS
jgi:molecular chaperone DnaK (HSP70)